ncbi:MAG: hypothetical protein HY900_05405 [Deltaproteobacteria bacterium]|nr:hypothetical protein [Deltaproteobacteria bacterium]
MAYSIELSDPELQLLKELLHGDEARLRVEIAHTDRRALKVELKERQELLRGLVGKLGSNAA